MTRTPSDAEGLDIERLFERWTDELDALDAAFAAPKPEPLVPGTAPGRPMTEAWIAEMHRRNDMLDPMAREMARVYATRLDAEGRRRVQALLAARSRVLREVQAA